MHIVVRLLPNDRWHEFSLPTNATFGQLKVTVLRHWKIIPEVFVPSVSQARGDGSTCPASSARQPLSAVQTSAQRSRKAPDTSHGNPPAGSNKEVITSMKSADDKRRTSWGSSIDRTQAIPSKSYSAPIDAIRECALILTSYSFRSVCSGCFLPDEAVLSKRCVENDLLVIQPRASNVSIDYRRFFQPFLRIKCTVHSVQSNEYSPSTDASKAALFFPEYPSMVNLHSVSSSARPSTASSIVSSSNRSVSSQFGRTAERRYKAVTLQVHGETLWFYRSPKDAQSDTEMECIKKYTLPAAVSSPSTAEGFHLKLGFLSGEIIIVKAANEADWNDLIHCLGPSGTSSSTEAGRHMLAWRQEVHSRAIRANTDLQTEPTKTYKPSQASKSIGAKSSLPVESKETASVFTPAATGTERIKEYVSSASNKANAGERMKRFAALVEQSHRQLDSTTAMQSEGQEQLRRARSFSHPSTAFTDESETILVSAALSHKRGDLRIDTPYQTCVDDLDNKEKSPDNKPLPLVTGKVSHQSLHVASHDRRNGLAPEQKAVGILDHVVVSRDTSPWSSVTPSPVSSEYPAPTPRSRMPKLVARDDRRTASRGLTNPTSNDLLLEEDYRRPDRPRAF